jgi:hypothetical protein
VDGPFVVRFAVVSGLAALTAVLLRDGLAGGGGAVTIIGAVTGALTLLGVLALARIVIAAERGKQERS